MYFVPKPLQRKYIFAIVFLARKTYLKTYFFSCAFLKFLSYFCTEGAIVGLKQINFNYSLCMGKKNSAIESGFICIILFFPFVIFLLKIIYLCNSLAYFILLLYLSKCSLRFHAHFAFLGFSSSLFL